MHSWVFFLAIVIMCLAPVWANNPLKLHHLPVVPESRAFTVFVSGLSKFQGLRPNPQEMVQYDLNFKFSGLTLRGSRHQLEHGFQLASGQISGHVAETIDIDPWSSTFETSIKIGPWPASSVIDAWVSLSLAVDHIDFDSDIVQASVTLARTKDTQTISRQIPRAQPLAQQFTFNYIPSTAGLAPATESGSETRGLERLASRLGRATGPSDGQLTFAFSYQHLKSRPEGYYSLLANDTRLPAPPFIFNSRADFVTHCLFTNSTKLLPEDETVIQVPSLLLQNRLTFIWQDWRPPQLSSHRVECPSIYLDLSHPLVRNNAVRFTFGPDADWGNILKPFWNDEMAGAVMAALP